LLFFCKYVSSNLLDFIYVSERNKICKRSGWFLFCRLLRLGTGIVKRFLSIDDEHDTVFSYYERGVPNKKHPSIVFIHGFSGEKESWLDLVKVSRNY